MTLVAVAVGGAFGAVARHVATEWIRDLAGTALPWGTLAVNVVGSLLLGFLIVWLPASAAPANARYFLAVGLLGSFTTFSTFSVEALTLLQSGAWGRAGMYVGASVAVGVAAAALGAATALAITQPAAR